MSYVDHLLVLCEAGGDSDEEILAFYQDIADRFLERVSEHYDRVKIHVECGLYVMQPGDSFIYAQDNARYARRSIRHSYSNTVAFYSEDLRRRSIKKASIIPNFEHAMIQTGSRSIYSQNVLPRMTVSLVRRLCHVFVTRTARSCHRRSMCRS